MPLIDSTRAIASNEFNDITGCRLELEGAAVILLLFVCIRHHFACIFAVFLSVVGLSECYIECSQD